MRAFANGRLKPGLAVVVAILAATALAGCCESTSYPYLVPRSKTIGAGETVSFSVKRMYEFTKGSVTAEEEGDATGDFTWTAAGPEESEVSKTGGSTAEWTAPETPGTYKIAAHGLMKAMTADDRTYMATAEAVVTVTEAPVAQTALDNGNGDGVKNGGKSPRVKFTQDIVVTEITAYHYNFGKGATPGQLSLKSDSGQTYGPWQTTGMTGQGNVPNAFWIAKPGADVPQGTYTVIDSDPGTWSQNAKSKGFGFATIKAEPAGK
jgi:hypothetical protein